MLVLWRDLLYKGSITTKISIETSYKNSTILSRHIVGRERNVKKEKKIFLLLSSEKFIRKLKSVKGNQLCQKAKLTIDQLLNGDTMSRCDKNICHASNRKYLSIYLCKFLTSHNIIGILCN